ncbi:HpcH/HpaI aldolase family protein [Paraburkholderia fynbosensis]|uniref:5-keto-4-deoxy-D-glucarate aldolase n=1 Tax=Paraburkholderia fynbosensis TaxID=1200993 RepID=A0A6J5GZ54_9BURK|nr:aldolase/citrate lyase family protein [Paraburkholderia fynbosensis]CAB3809699.1 5-keto-4-deoxy-D-glucarate aldolase [Paraburkholderia fynbosensis]
MIQLSSQAKAATEPLNGEKALDSNRVRDRLDAGVICYGTYIRFPGPAPIEIAAQAGFEFVRIDAYHVAFDPQTLDDMIRAAHAHQVTPWIRCRNDAYEITKVLDMGAHAISAPNVGTVREAQALVSAVRFAPKGQRESSRPVRYHGMGLAEYVEWAEREILVSCQIEGAEGLENYKDIVKVEGLDVIQTGRNDIALALGLPGQQFHKDVLDAEARIVDAALTAGKQVSLAHPLNEDGIERSLRWAEKGVRILTMGSDIDSLFLAFKSGVRQLRSGQTRSL